MPNPRVNRPRFEPSDEVWVPLSEVNRTHPGFEPGHGGMVVRGTLRSRVGAQGAPGTPRTWRVEVPGLPLVGGGPLTIEVSSRRLRRHAKVLIFRIGDWNTEQLLLNPLADSLKAQISLLLPPNEVDVEYVRSLDEVASALRLHGGGQTRPVGRQASPWAYAVLVGHGRDGTSAGIRFGNTWVTPAALAAGVKGLGPGRRSFSDAVFVSLCCSTGRTAFASAFSRALTTTFVGPGDDIHSYEAAVFVQRFFYEMFVGGETPGPAISRSRAATTGFKTQFRGWINGGEVIR